MADVKEIYNDLLFGQSEFRKDYPEQMKTYAQTRHDYIEVPGALDVKTKQIIGVAVAVFARCDYCIVSHTCMALEAGATPKELKEAVMVAAFFGGGPAMSYGVVLMRETIDKYYPEIKKKLENNKS